MISLIKIIINRYLIFIIFIYLFAYSGFLSASDKYVASSVAIHDNYAIVGYYNSSNYTGNGYAEIFFFNNERWSSVQSIFSSGGTNTFGISVAISNNYAIVGSKSSKVLIYKRDGNTWSIFQEIGCHDKNNRKTIVDISGNNALVCVEYEKAFILTLNNDSWSKEEIAYYSGTGFGCSGSISGDYAIVGASSDDGNVIKSGAAYIFKRNETKWLQLQKIYAEDGKTDDYFGQSVSISENYAIIGCRSAAYIFERSEDKWLQKQKLTGSGSNTFGRSVGITDSFAIISSSSIKEIKGCFPAVVYIFKNINDSWRSFPKFLESNNTCNLGSHIDISDNTIIVSDQTNTYNNVKRSHWLKRIILNAEECSISGYLLDKQKHPLADINVESFVYGQTKTDYTGHYCFNDFCLFLEDTCLYDNLIFSNGTLTIASSYYCVTNTNIENFSINSFIISGYIKNPSNYPIEGVTIQFSNDGGFTSTDEYGFYRNIVYQGWSGKATPTGQGFQYEPFDKSYNNIKENQTDQNYTGKKMNISGYIFNPNHQPIKDVQLTFTNPDRTITTDANGFYNLVLDYQWTGSVTPQKIGFNFQPEKHDYYKIFTSRAYMNYRSSQMN